MELATFIPLRETPRIFTFTRAELAEVFGGFGHDVGEELHFYAAEGFSYSPNNRQGENADFSWQKERNNSVLGTLQRDELGQQRDIT